MAHSCNVLRSATLSHGWRKNRPLGCSSHRPWRKAPVSEERVNFRKVPPSASDSAGIAGLFPNSDASPRQHVRFRTSWPDAGDVQYLPTRRLCLLLYSTTKGRQGRRKGHWGGEAHGRPIFTERAQCRLPGRSRAWSAQTW